MPADLGTQQDVDMVNAQPTELATLMELDEEAPDPNDGMEATQLITEQPVQPPGGGVLPTIAFARYAQAPRCLGSRRATPLLLCTGGLAPHRRRFSAFCQRHAR